MQPNIEYYTTQAAKLLLRHCSVQVLVHDCLFAEGPLWHCDGYYLFSDIPANCIYKLSAGGGKQVWLQPSGFTGTEKDKTKLSEQIGSNGLAQTKTGAVIMCQHGNGAVAIAQPNNTQPLVNQYNKKRLNSPNDVVVASDGSVYFTDPPYGLKDAQLQPEWAQPTAGVYCWRQQQLQLFCTDYQYPNGVCLSADERWLYVCSNKPFEKFVTIFDAQTLKKKGVLATENSDGIKCDGRGHLWLCTKEGIVVIDEKTGERLLRIQLSTVPANICFGGAEKNEVLVTARENVF